MIHADLGEPCAARRQLVHQFNTNRAAASFKVNRIERAFPDQPKIAIDIHDRQSKQLPGEPGVNTPEQFSMQSVRAVQLITVYDIDSVAHGLIKPFEFANVVLPIAVGVKDEIFGRNLETGPQCGAVAFVCLMSNDAEKRYLRQQSFKYLGRRIPAAVVDDNYFGIAGKSA